jgi:tRNA-modifying protein YgfZ
VSDETGYSALRDGLGAFEWERDIVRVSGPDAESYLQGQTSQDIAKLVREGSAWALVLQPQGKLDVFVRVTRVAPDEFVLDTDAGMGAPLVARLTRFKLRTKVDIEQLAWRVVAVRGAATGQAPPSAGEGPVVVALFEWGGLIGYDLLGPNPGRPAAATPVGPAAYEAARVEAGFPRHGSELDERTIPAEAGLVEATVSFTKGCYTGQELVARIDSRGSNVPRRLRGFILSGPARPGARLYPVQRGDGPVSEAPSEAGAGADADESSRPPVPKELGRLTSVALSPRSGWVALGYVGRAVETGATVVARDEEDEFEARVEPLPLA